MAAFRASSGTEGTASKYAAVGAIRKSATISALGGPVLVPPPEMGLPAPRLGRPARQFRPACPGLHIRFRTLRYREPASQQVVMEGPFRLPRLSGFSPT